MRTDGPTALGLPEGRTELRLIKAQCLDPDLYISSVLLPGTDSWSQNHFLFLSLPGSGHLPEPLSPLNFTLL